MAPQPHRFTWQGILIEVVYTPRYFPTVDHLAVQSVEPINAPLPISRTGCRSHFLQPGTVEACGGDVVRQVVVWLDAEATKPEWRAVIEANRQGDLFG